MRQLVEHATRGRRIRRFHEVKRRRGNTPTAHFPIDGPIDPVGQETVQDGGEHQIDQHFHTPEASRPGVKAAQRTTSTDAKIP